jgi:formylglycine-generating enzyme required for sulfatase activity
MLCWYRLLLVVLATAGCMFAVPVRVEPADKPESKNGDTLELNLGGVKLELVRIKAGMFLMGSANNNERAAANEKPQHEVTITKDFYMGKYLVTQEQWVRVMGKNPARFSAKGIDKARVAGLDTRRFPVDCITWQEARKFCMAVSSMTKRRVDLPTEAQWEYACRAGTTTHWYCGDTFTGADANWNFNGKAYQQGRTCEVDKYPPNPWGLYDMSGNLHQWCLDYLDADYYAKSPKVDPCNDSGKQRQHALRGGCWLDGAGMHRSANRFLTIQKEHRTIGFRVVVRAD